MPQLVSEDLPTEIDGSPQPHPPPPPKQTLLTLSFGVGRDIGIWDAYKNGPKFGVHHRNISSVTQASTWALTRLTTLSFQSSMLNICRPYGYLLKGRAIMG